MDSHFETPIHNIDCQALNLFYKNVNPCKYWDTQAFFKQKIPTNSLFIVHINIRSLPKMLIPVNVGIHKLF